MLESLIYLVLLIVYTIILLFIQHPIQHILGLLIIFIIAGFFLLTLKLEFFAFLLIIIYGGAITILFLYCLMLFNLNKLNIKYFFLFNIWGLSSFLFIGLIVFFFLKRFLINELFFISLEENLLKNLTNKDLKNIDINSISYLNKIFYLIEDYPLNNQFDFWVLFNYYIKNKIHFFFSKYNNYDILTLKTLLINPLIFTHRQCLYHYCAWINFSNLYDLSPLTKIGFMLFNELWYITIYIGIFLFLFIVIITIILEEIKVVKKNDV